MPIRKFKCTVCGHETKTKAKTPMCQHDEIKTIAPSPMTLVLVAPSTQFMEKTDPERGKSALVDQQKILKERARQHSRDVDMDQLIQNNKPEDAIKNGWVNESGVKRKAIDDK